VGVERGPAQVGPVDHVLDGDTIVALLRHQLQQRLPQEPAGAAHPPVLTRSSHTRFAGPAFQDIDNLPLDVLRAYLEPLVGTKDRAKQYQRWIASLHNRDLVAVEPALKRLTVPTLMVWGTDDAFFKLRHAHWLRETIPGATGVVTVDGGQLFFPDERAAELVTHLRAHWAAHSAH